MRGGKLPSSCQASPRPLTPVPYVKMRRNRDTRPDLYLQCCRSTTHSRSVSPHRSLCISIHIPGPEPLLAPTQALRKRSPVVRYKSELRSRGANSYVSIRNKREFSRPEVSLVLELPRTSQEDDFQLSHKLLDSMKDHYRVLHKYPKTTSQCYKTVQVLGSPGSTVRVTLSLQRLTGLPVVIKCVPRLSSKAQRVRTLREVANQTRCRHPQVVRLLEVFESAQYLNLVFEHCRGGTLLEYLQGTQGMKEKKARQLFLCVAVGLQACHVQGIAHRDLQLSTILLTEAHDSAKISSFSSSQQVDPSEKLAEQGSQLAYSAPETLVGQHYDGFTADWWSLGVVLYALLTGQLPFQACNAAELTKAILKGSFALPTQVSLEAKSLISGLLQPIPKYRFDLDTVLSHSWLCQEQVPQAILSVDIQAVEAIRGAGLSKSHLLACLQTGEWSHLTAAYELMTLEKKYSVGD